MERLALMPKYDDYVDSGVEWLGRVPASWELTRLGTRFNERRSKVSDIDYPALSVTKKGVLPQLDNAAKTKDGDNRKLVKEGDFVINSRSDRKGSSGVSDRDGSVSLINIVLKPKGIHPKFSEHLLKSHAFIEEYYRVGRGIVADLWTTRYDEMRTIAISVPSLEEQTRIANFLDKKTAQIDEAIAIKEQQISLLKERKQIIIQQAVTQGLDSNVPMKDSGVDWIGQIPAHWDISITKYVLRKLNRPRKKNGDTVICSNHGCSKLLGEVNQGLVSLTQHDYQGVEIGDLLVHGMDAWHGAIAIAAHTGDCTSVVHVCDTHQNKEYIAYFLKMLAIMNVYKVISNGVRGNTSDFRSWSKFGEIQLILPPIDEQNSIVELLNEQIQMTDHAIELSKQQITGLKEYKTTLINSAVTGKIKITPEMVEQ